MADTNRLRPANDDDLRDAIADARRSGQKLVVTGGGTKAGLGRPVGGTTCLDMSAISGVVDYDPAELVLTVRAGTRLREIQDLLAEHDQRLAFSPFDHGPIYGKPDGSSTIGGVIAAGVAGSHRLSQGGVRDHLLGFTAVSGRGEQFFAGAKVVKNVTGYDLSKLMCGSWGRLAALTEVTLKVLPRPQQSVTVTISGLDPHRAYVAMARALGSQAEVAAAAHFPHDKPSGNAQTIFKIEGFGPSVAARSALLHDLLADIAPAVQKDIGDSEHLWDELRTLRSFGAACPLWRINVTPRASVEIALAFQLRGARWIQDWGGGLIWLGFDGDPDIVRDAAAAAAGHASLIRASADIRQQIPPFQPAVAGVSALEARVRRAFDPVGIFETGRF